MTNLLVRDQLVDVFNVDEGVFCLGPISIDSL